MRISDLPAVLAALGLGVFFIFPETRIFYEQMYGAAPLILTFIKFALLATGGEILAYRIVNGKYPGRTFGVLPKMIVWGFLGLAIYAAFTIFSSGVPSLVTFTSELNKPWSQVWNAFFISFFMNLFFAPIMMIIHHVTDMHIGDHNGHFRLKISLLHLLERTNWKRMWNIVLKKTIPLFWIPAHTLTFLLPGEYRTLFAALLSVVLGLFLGIWGQRRGNL